MIPLPVPPDRTVAVRLVPLAGLLRAAFTHQTVSVRLVLCVIGNQRWDLTGDTTPGRGTALLETTPGPVAVAFTVARQFPALGEDALTATFAPAAGGAADTLRTAPPHHTDAA
ncbi:hypothetical protein [Streptomyces luteireticuli]|uniref:hypothetical protein n=1 Tax=Streptomyces luteireticuli TaxID=173858 RepID=UPI003556176E